ncbi:MAG: type II toxin-antitoxin system HicA family toxin [Acidobacteria bacterium]|nr:type II toxin-antitoxin system HicA family toxin [Acidobacteriota bacterium]
MNKKQRATLEAIFAKPTKATIKFADIEKLLVGLDAQVVEGAGSRVVFRMPNGRKWETHRPHPGKEAKKYQVENVRKFLEELGVK